MAISKFLDPKNDFAFKKIFGTQKNKNILIHFLNDIMDFKGDDEIKDVTFLKTIHDPEIASKRQSIVDVLCTDQVGRYCIIEMQVARTKGFEKRAQYYAAKAYVSQRNAGTDYPDLKEVIFLAITDFVMFPEKKAYKSDHVVLDKETYDHDLKDFSFTFLELPKFKKSIDDLKTPLEKWAYFFKHAQETRESDVEKIMGQDIVIGQAYEALNQFGWSEAELFTYEQDEKSIMDARAILAAQIEDLEKVRIAGEKAALEKGMQQGMEKGMEERSKQIARTMKENGMNTDTIVELTGLSLEEIQELYFSV